MPLQYPLNKPWVVTVAKKLKHSLSKMVFWTLFFSGDNCEQQKGCHSLRESVGGAKLTASVGGIGAYWTPIVPVPRGSSGMS